MQNRKSIMALYIIMRFKNMIFSILSAHLIWCTVTMNTYREHQRLRKHMYTVFNTKRNYNEL